MRAGVSKERPTAQDEGAVSKDEESLRSSNAIALVRDWVSTPEDGEGADDGGTKQDNKQRRHDEQDHRYGKDRRQPRRLFLRPHQPFGAVFGGEHT